MINESLVFGIDLGIGSCGWAVLREPQSGEEAGAVEGIGAWLFDVPETDKDRKPTNQIRRENRLLRRVIRRRRNRMAELRRLFRQSGLLSSDNADALKIKGADPWKLRAEGLERILAPAELAVVLGHIAKRRGFSSSAKRKTANALPDEKPVLAAIGKTKEKLARYQTIGALYAQDPEFSGRKRNRAGVYDRTASRDDLKHEVKLLFEKQRKLGSEAAKAGLEQDYCAIAFRQQPMQDSERLVGLCTFEKQEQRAAKLSPSFEKFRLLQRLTSLRISTPAGERALTPDELARITKDIGRTSSLSVRKVHTLLGLPDEQWFTTIKREKDDIAVRSGECLAGTAALRKALGEDMWALMQGQAELLDRIAHIMSFFETNDRIMQQLQALGLDGDVLEALRAGLDAGRFAGFKGAAHISAKAARALLPHLEQGRRYDEACALAGYDHSATSLSYTRQITDKASFNALVAEMGDNIANPIARKALTEGLKQLWALRNRYGLPGAICLELARDVGKSMEERQKEEKRLDATTEQRKKERKQAAECLGVETVNADTLLRYRLWKEQNGRCIYTDQKINPEQITAGDNSVQVDHILPWSRFGDDSYNNKTLCLASANQHKRNDTPFEWFSREKNPEDWNRFVAVVEGNKSLSGYKKRNYLLKNAADAENRFRSRNLNDTRYACRLLAEAVKLFYPRGERQEKGGNRRVFTRPGALTAALRVAWGLESLKKVDGKRVQDDRHHGLDALVVAAASEAEINKLTRSYQQWKEKGLSRPLRQVPEPWEGFRDQAKEAFASIFVARPERRRARGEGHAATILQKCSRDGKEVLFQRKAVTNLTEADLERIKDAERNGAIITAIREWIAAGRKPDALPLTPWGDVISKVRIQAKERPAVPVRGGSAGRGDMVRVDVFSRPDRHGKEQWFLVPVYPHQVMNRKNWSQPPMRAITAHKDEAEWPVMGAAHRFRFSLYPHSFVGVIKQDGEIIEGYFAGVDRSTGAISLKSAHNPTDIERGIGAKKLLSITKYSVDRFGSKTVIGNEVRTWHGVVCTSPGQPG